MTPNPKSEIRNPKEARNPKSEKGAQPDAFQISSFGFVSNFELRISGFTCA